MGLDVLQSLQVINRVPCGFAGSKDVGQRSLDDRMDSYFLSETIKYLYLLFDDQHWLRKNPYVFNTEGHPFPVRPDWLNLTNGVGEGEPGERASPGGSREDTSPGGWEGGFTCKMPQFRRRISAYGFEKLLAEEEGIEEVSVDILEGGVEEVRFDIFPSPNPASDDDMVTQCTSARSRSSSMACTAWYRTQIVSFSP